MATKCEYQVHHFILYLTCDSMHLLYLCLYNRTPCSQLFYTKLLIISPFKHMDTTKNCKN